MATTNTHQSRFSLVFLSMVIIILLASQTKARDLCAKTSYPELCKPAVKGITKPKAAIEAAIQDLISQTKVAESLAAKNKDDKNIEVCNSVFDAAIGDLEKSLSYLKANDKASLSVSLSAALTNFVTCSDSLEEIGDEANPIFITNANLRKMASNCLELAT